MEPKTKLQKKVVELSSTLPGITEEQTKYAYDKCLVRYAVRSRKTLYCLECGHSWKNEELLLTSIMGCTCPSCGQKLKMKQYYRPRFTEAVYFGILTTVEGMQVVRMFIVSKTCIKKAKPNYFAEECMQHWVTPVGKIQTLARSTGGFTYCYDRWDWSSELEVRTLSFSHMERRNLVPYKIYPEKRILPIIKRNGFNGSYYGFAPHNLFALILRDKIAETLLKTSQISMLTYRNRSPEIVDEYWSSIKICIRNKYIINDASMWIDTLSLLKHFGKDLLNSKYVCPDDLKFLHDKLVNKKRDHDSKLRLEELRKKMEADQLEYAKQKAKFLDLRFSDGEILVKPIESVEEFMNEGEALKHCVFTNGYYKYEKSLILSARIKNKPIETIEVSLSDFSIIQSRGLHNKATEFHERIISLVQDNIQHIAKRVSLNK